MLHFLTWEIRPCKFTMILSGRRIVGPGSVYFSIKITEPDFFAVDADGGEPFSLTFTERYAAITGVSV